MAEIIIFTRNIIIDTLFAFYLFDIVRGLLVDLSLISYRKS